jgi:HipA-like protein
MAHKIFSFWKHSPENQIVTPQNVHIVFELSYKNVLIGLLELNNGTWKFGYSDEFKNQNSLLPIVDFPAIDKIYESKELWPFFMSRIPGLGQPIVQQIIKKNKINDNDEVSLLKQFGKKTIANPYILEPAF